jgi:DNA (cytosine-5)-methyltransferase 1
MTDEVSVINVEDILGVCYVLPFAGFKTGDLADWLSLSPDHYYAQYQTPTIRVKSWDELEPLDAPKLCETCSTARMEWKALMTEFLDEKPLRTLDLFAGAGAFGLAMEQTGCVKITHAVEISPSAAETFRCAVPPMKATRADFVISCWVE